MEGIFKIYTKFFKKKIDIPQRMAWVSLTPRWLKPFLVDSNVQTSLRGVLQHSHFSVQFKNDCHGLRLAEGKWILTCDSDHFLPAKRRVQLVSI